MARGRKKVNITLNPELLSWAKQNKMNLSGLLEAHLWHIKAGIQKGGIGPKGTDMQPPGFEPGLRAWKARVLARLDDGCFSKLFHE